MARSEYRALVGHQVVAQLKDETIGGRLAGAGPATVTIAGAWLLSGSSQERVELDGTVVVERARLRWMQALDGSTREAAP